MTEKKNVHGSHRDSSLGSLGIHATRNEKHKTYRNEKNTSQSIQHICTHGRDIKENILHKGKYMMLCSK